MMDDHDLLIANAMKLDGMSEKLMDFIEAKRELCVKHECRMDQQDDLIDKQKESIGGIDKRVATLETYFKVSVGALVVAVGVFGVYVLNLVVNGAG
jgi:hypothetical protein